MTGTLGGRPIEWTTWIGSTSTPARSGTGPPTSDPLPLIAAIALRPRALALFLWTRVRR